MVGPFSPPTTYIVLLTHLEKPIFRVVAHDLGSCRCPILIHGDRHSQVLGILFSIVVFQIRHGNFVSWLSLLTVIPLVPLFVSGQCACPNCNFVRLELLPARCTMAMFAHAG